jgi:general nucleoside transport system permease protein
MDAIDFFLSVLRMSMPILFAALGGYYSERSGVVNISLEGKILLGAFIAACVADSFGSAWIATVVACCAVTLASLGYGLVTVYGKSNQIVAGTALNLLIIGFLPFFTKLFFDTTNNTPSLPLTSRLGHEIYIVLVTVVVVSLYISKFTIFGLWHRTAGEAPNSLRTAGIDVRLIRIFSLCCTGVLCGLAGSTLSLYLSSGYTKNMSAGRGFMAVAAVVLGNWKPERVVLACLFFGIADAIQMRLQGSSLFGWPVSTQLVQAIPYLLTLFMISGVLGRSKSPEALGR